MSLQWVHSNVSLFVQGFAENLYHEHTESFIMVLKGCLLVVSMV